MDWSIVVPTDNELDLFAFVDVSDDSIKIVFCVVFEWLKFGLSAVVADEFSFAIGQFPVVEACVMRSIATAFETLLSSIVIVFGWTTTMQNGPFIRDWSLLYSLFSMASAVISNVARSSGLSRKT